MMGSTDLLAAIAALEAKRAELAVAADCVDAEIQAAVAATRAAGERQNEIVARQSALTQAIEWAQVALYVAGLVEEAKTSERRASLSVIGGRP